LERTWAAQWNEPLNWLTLSFIIRTLTTSTVCTPSAHGFIGEEKPGLKGKGNLGRIHCTWSAGKGAGKASDAARDKVCSETLSEAKSVHELVLGNVVYSDLETPTHCQVQDSPK
jgi:hypothetical protein